MRKYRVLSRLNILVFPIEFDNEEESVADQITKTLENDELPNLTDKEIQEATTKIQTGLKDYEVRKLEDEVTEDIKETEVDANPEEDLIEKGSSISRKKINSKNIFFFAIISHKK